MSEKIKLSDVRAYALATDVKFDAPVEMKYDGVTYSFTAVIEYAGASVEQVLELATRMAKTDFMNGLRPNTNDKADVIRKKEGMLAAYVQQRRVPIRVAEKTRASLQVTPEMAIAQAAASGDIGRLKELMALLQAAMNPGDVDAVEGVEE